ncbi:phosphoglycolate phosphatase [Methylomagnum ishizawai]|uniref:phosphoglycolate phosphatase n=1 Tax=Methylomagnum ishizawai TaxID=1760988 RepID=UPI001C330DB9|nr:phosphoglycolate phosphatase [Methylomagnum ishizawai]BBL76537.1 phosphoglycolate phosphatase 1 [Methylomagnum ishizawai]
MLPSRPGLIVFDLDGTLVDSAPDIAQAVDIMLGRLGLPRAGEVRVRGWIGNGVEMLVKRALTGVARPEGEPPRFREALDLFMDAYAGHMCDRSRVYPGVMDGLAAIKAGGFPTACVTNKHSRFTQTLLEQLGLAPYLDFVGSGDQFGQHKPHPEPLLKTAAHFGVAPAQSLMVGDSANDAEAAHRAGFMLALVPYGYHGAVDLAALEPDVVVESIADLPGLFEVP